MMKPGRLFKKFISFVFIAICTIATLKVYGQKITIKEVNTPLDSVFRKIQQQTNYSFVYTTETLKKANTVSVEFNNMPLKEALKQLFSNQPLGYTIYNNLVIIKEKGAAQTEDVIATPTVTTQQTYTISGTVNDEKGQSVPGATVFITGSKIGVAANASGEFILNGLTPGNYELVVSMIGFDPYIQSIRIQDKDINISVVLKESNSVLKEVAITAIKPKIKKRYLDWFTRNFIGFDANASQCKILNPEVLNFSRPNGQYELVATANDFLLIENDALGYKIKYLLKRCVYYMKYDICYFDGSSYFEEMKGTPEQQKKWEENRKKAYIGSRRHFLMAVMNNRSRAEGFFTYVIDYHGNHYDRSNLKPVDIDTMVKAAGNNLKTLISKPYGAPRPAMYVYYARALGDEDALTWVEQCVDTVVIDKNGGTIPDGNEFFNYTFPINKNRGLSPGVAFSFWGRWATQRVADLTPSDYFAETVPDSAFLKSIVTTGALNKNEMIKKLKDILPFDLNSLIGGSTVYRPPSNPAPDSSKNKAPGEKLKKTSSVIDSLKD